MTRSEPRAAKCVGKFDGTLIPADLDTDEFLPYATVKQVGGVWVSSDPWVGGPRYQFEATREKPTGGHFVLQWEGEEPLYRWVDA